MHRLKHTYYTDKLLDGYVSQDGVRSRSPKYYQGEDIKLAFYLDYNGVPVSEDKYIIEVFVKKSQSANNVLWKAVIGNGLYRKGKEGDFYILLPASASSKFLPGVYYLDVKITEKIGEGDDVKDLSLVLLSTTFTLELGASSPNPKLAANKVEETSYDPSTGITTIKITTVEPTLPKHTDRG